jgi:hypothetical protein
VDVRDLQRRLRRLGASDRFASLWLNPGGTRDSVTFRLVSQRSPSRLVAAGAAYDNDLGGRFWLGQVNRRFLGRDIELTAATLLGELRQEVLGGLRFALSSGANPLPMLKVNASRELVRQFEDGNEGSPLIVHEGIGVVGVEASWSDGWRGSLGLEGRMWDVPDQTGQSAAGPILAISKAGRTAESVFQLQAGVNGEYSRLELEGIATVTLGKLKIRPGGRYGLGESLPAQRQFVFGGVDGFAGLHIGELRSERELSGSLVFLYPVKGPLLFRIEPMAGASGGDSGILPEGDVLTGIRVGFNISTGLGPIRLEYGISSEGRDGLLVRIGQWF